MTDDRRLKIDLDAKEPIRDLSDFCLRWAECRSTVERGLAQLHKGSAPENAGEFAVAVNWLCHLADRVCLDFQA